MPNIKPISDLRNYIDVLHDVSVGFPVFAPGDHNFTEIRVMPLPVFRRFVMSENVEFLP